VSVENAPQVSIIIPSLNEESHICLLLESIKNQSSISYEILIVDGGSKDETLYIARQHNAKVMALPGHGEFISRNIGAKMAKGKLLLFTCADIVFPKNLFQKVVEKFERNPELIALTGPGHPFDAPFFGKLEYAVYNLIRYLFASLPKSLKRFSTSTNFLVVRKDYFNKTGGFVVDNINADGLMGKKLLKLGEVAFFLDTYIYLSARRMKNMGFFAFNRHYLYALENFFFFTSNTGVINGLKLRSKKKHRKIHEI
jgi:glycosyltransferase involved in cell wall biosynthesis